MGRVAVEAAWCDYPQ